ncbi:MAG: hypothetical protein J6R04_05520 [Clostridia bacterium]|nr:hypothetical protein [Clostridia bacterium]
MKSYSFERVNGEEHVEIHRKNHGFRLGAKLFCLVLAFLFWLVVANVRLHQAGENLPDADQPSAADQAQ